LLFQVLTEGLAVFALGLVLWHRVNKWWAAFLGLAFLSMMYPFYDRAGFLTFNMVLYASVWYALIVLFVKPDQIETLLNAICIVALLNVCMQVLQVSNIDPLYAPRYGERDITVGLMSNQNEVSALLAFSFPAFLRGKWKWGLIPLMFGFIAAKTTGGVMALGAGVVFWAWLQGHFWKALAAAAVGLTLYVLVVDGFQMFDRWYAWMHGLKLWKQHWLLGGGIGHWKIIMQQIPPDQQWWTTAHNEYVQGLFEMGIGFAVILGGYLLNIYKRGVRLFRERIGIVRGGSGAPMGLCLTALVIIGVNSLVNFPFHIAITGFLAVTWMALLEVECRSRASA
jgi:hypothetical protein